MSSKRRLRRRSCESKVGYADEATAVWNAGRLRYAHGGGTWRAYRCKHCGRWHVGRPNKNDLRAMNARRAAAAE